jgi:hypothetical protein
MFSFRCQHYEKMVHSPESFSSIHCHTFKISHVGAIFMIIKNQKRAILTEMGFIFVTAVISALFFTDVLQLDSVILESSLSFIVFMG